MKTNDIQSKIEKLQAEQNAIENLMEVLPAEFSNPDLLVWQNSKLCEFTLKYEVENLEQVKQWVKLWDKFIQPLTYSKGLFTSFITPMHKNDNGESRGCTVTNVPANPVTVSVSKYGLEFKFYAFVDGHLLSIDIEFKYGAPFAQYANTTWRMTGSADYRRVEGQMLHAPAFKNYKSIKWASGSADHPSAYTLYWMADTAFEDIFS